MLGEPTFKVFWDRFFFSGEKTPTPQPTIHVTVAAKMEHGMGDVPMNMDILYIHKNRLLAIYIYIYIILYICIYVC